MTWYQWLAFGALMFCSSICFLYMFRLIKLGKPVDFARPAGNTRNAILYSFTGAMSPKKKESAYLHLPTYTAGMLYHMGTFLSIALFFFILTGYHPTKPLTLLLSGLLVVSGGCGLAIFIKRIIKRELQSLSNPDDYISNLLVTGFHLFSVSVLLFSDSEILYFLWASILFFYLPFGKLKHTLYFFAARYQLGYFFGWRGSWPGKSIKG